ncbi:MAG: shikimate kinase [Rhizobiaceae bacterium]|nr:shikimate kinase [Rhizobiaceae bacterium]
MTVSSRQMRIEIIEKLGNKCLVFVGMMGSGKSAIGRMVATALELDFHDSDLEIEKAADMSVAEIFEKLGEDEFRRGEQKVIERVLGAGPLVLALGGGAFLSEATREIIGKRATSIWLTADVDLLHSRVMRKPGKRPLLENGDARQILTDLSNARNPIYQLADLKIESLDASRLKTRDAVIARLHDFFCDGLATAGNS